MKAWKKSVMALALALGVFTVALPASNALAINVFEECGNQDSAVCKAEDEKAVDMTTTVINTLLFALGIIAVIMIIIGGIRYATSNGESAQTKAAKDTILYAVVGLVVAMLAYAIVNFVVSRF